jgi:hypothetical protein
MYGQASWEGSITPWKAFFCVANSLCSTKLLLKIYMSRHHGHLDYTTSDSVEVGTVGVICEFWKLYLWGLGIIFVRATLFILLLL